jgi:tetratricopeptide (TPR) repeat protein
VLQRATQSEHGLKASARAAVLLDHLVGAHPVTLAGAMVPVMIDTSGVLASVLDRRVGELDAEALGAIDNALPRRSLSLLDLSLRVSARRADLARHKLTAADEGSESRTDWESHLGARLNTLGIRLFNLGRREEALAANQEALAIRRRLAEAHPDAFLPDLAMSLNNIGIRLSALGRREEARAASQEALAIYRRLAEARPDAFLPDLAMSLHNIGSMLSDLGRREEARRPARRPSQFIGGWPRRAPTPSYPTSR